MLFPGCSYYRINWRGTPTGAAYPCSFCYLLLSLLLCIIFIGMVARPWSLRFPGIIVFIIMHVACTASKTGNNIYLFEPFSFSRDGAWSGGRVTAAPLIHHEYAMPAISLPPSVWLGATFVKSHPKPQVTHSSFPILLVEVLNLELLMNKFQCPRHTIRSSQLSWLYHILFALFSVNFLMSHCRVYLALCAGIWFIFSINTAATCRIWPLMERICLPWCLPAAKYRNHG